ncbi:MAG: ABC transporter permease [Bauldia sp.]
MLFGIGCAIVGLHVLVAIVTLFWTPFDPLVSVGGRLDPPSFPHWAGTDRLGRDLGTQILIGSRVALIVGLGSVAIGAVIGVTLGVLSGFATRWRDDALAVTFDILIAFPTLLLAMLIVAVRDEADLFASILAIGIAMSAIIARLTRILVRRVLRQDFVIAARTSGGGWLGIVFRHVLPNIWPTLAVNFALQFGIAVITEASLAYLGLGTPPPNASWGSLLQEAQQTIYTAPIGAIAPGVALVSLIVGINLVADGLRDLLDPTRRGFR